MNPPVSALRPASDVPAEEAALDGALAELREAIGVLDLDHLDRLNADTVLTVLAKTAALGRGIDAILTAVSTEVVERSDPAHGSDGLAARLNFAKPSHLIEMVAGVSAATASQLIRVGSRTSARTGETGLPLPPLFPVVGDALRAGEIGVETAEAISRELTLAAPRADVSDIAVAEQELVRQATAGGDMGLPLPPDLITIQARQWRDRLDQDGIEPRAEKAFQDRDFWVSRMPKNGLVKFGGQVTLDVGGKLLALLDAVISSRTAPRFVPDQDAATDESSVDEGRPAGTVPDTAATVVPRETRTPGQIRADVFAAMIDSLARSSDAPTVTGAAPTVVVRVTGDVLTNEKGTGEIVGIPDPVAYSTLKQILCDSSVLPAIIDPDGALVALGAEQRLFSRVHRMGMIARDGPTCGIEGCNIPASGCEAHHLIEYSDGGQTHTDNGALFCWFHHRMIDTGVFSAEIVDGKLKITIPDWLQRKPYFR